MYIIIAIIAFGLLIAIHEFGHFIVAKACGVKVNEFSIGMGPTLLKKQGGETLYSLRLLPIGGFCAMEGEDEDTGDERAFARQSAWKKALILVAGAAMNFILGFIIVAVIYSSAAAFTTNEVVGTAEGFKYAENGIEVGDRIYSIDGHRVFYSSDFSTYMQRAGSTVDMVVIREGEKVTLRDYGLKPEKYADGVRYGLNFGVVEADAWQKIKYTGYTTYNFVRMVWMGLSDLVTGAAGLRDMAGVVGIVGEINNMGHEVEEQQSRRAAIEQVMYLVAFIAVNLAVMNLLPIPALDGGRIFFLVINLIIEGIFHKKLDPKYEGYVHAAGMVALLGLMAVIMVSDIMKLV